MSRALRFASICMAACAFTFALATSAVADGPETNAAAPEPPRAQPIARGFVTADYAPSFNSLVEKAIAAAADLSSLSQVARAVAAERRPVEAAVATLAAQRGGLLT